MSPHLERLQQGRRWWTAEVVLRGIGLLLLASCYRLALFTHRVVALPHHATPGDFALCLGIIASLTCGLALSLFGPRLLAEVPLSALNAPYWKDR
ncbi:hypothetical protein [Novosphingobium colocasiae]|nr:hypothetical protein [Novosphingobium colocasiae]